jgi:hypothetical protein
LGEGDKPGDPEAVLAGADGSPRLLFIRVPEAKSTKNRVHLDLEPPAGKTGDEEIERAIELGARLIDDRREPGGRGWAVLVDPEDNEFCIERREDEYRGSGPNSV